MNDKQAKYVADRVELLCNVSDLCKEYDAILVKLAKIRTKYVSVESYKGANNLVEFISVLDNTFDILTDSINPSDHKGYDQSRQHVKDLVNFIGKALDEDN